MATAQPPQGGLIKDAGLEAEVMEKTLRQNYGKGDEEKGFPKAPSMSSSSGVLSFSPGLYFHVFSREPHSASCTGGQKHTYELTMWASCQASMHSHVPAVMHVLYVDLPQ